MPQSEVAPTFGRVLADTEARLFVGRTGEIECLVEALNAARRRPAVLYVHGPTGIGKSALLRAFRRVAESRNVPVLHVDAAALEPTAEAILGDLCLRLGVDGAPGVLPQPRSVVGALHRRAGRGEVLVLVDGYDAVAGRDAWLRRELFQHLGGGVCLALAGRRHPADIWPDDPSWLAALSQLALGPLAAAEARELLQRMGLDHPGAIRHCIAVSDGRPALLGLAAVFWMQRLRHIEDPSFGTQPEDRHRMDAAVLERFIHPTSRRLAWRAGVGNSDLDRLIAAGGIMRSFDRQVLAAVVGEVAVAQAWPQLQALPVVEQVQGIRYMVVPGAREALAGVVRRQRPWAERRWRHRACDYHLQRVLEGVSRPIDAWSEMVHLVRGAHGDPEERSTGGRGWTWRWGAPAVELEELQDCWERAVRAGGGAAAQAGRTALGRLASVCSGSVLQARDGAGRLLGYGVLAPVDAATLAALRGTGDASTGLAGGREDISLVLQIALDREAAPPELAPALTAHLCAGMIPAVGAGADASPARDLAMLPAGAGRDGAGPAAPIETHVVRLPASGYLEWLRGLIDVSADRVPSPAARADAAREALQALQDDRRLQSTALGRFYAVDGRLPPGTSLRTLILDALATADLDMPSVSGRELLTLYYVQRMGTHEVVAERLSLPRTTYFRYHREALARLGDALFRL